MNGIFVSLLSDAGPWALVVMALIVFTETGVMAGFFLPGDSMLFSAGVLVAAGVVEVPLVVVVATVASAAFLGDQVGYAIGRHYGPKVLNRPGSRFLSPSHVTRAQEFFAQHGARAVIIARFVPFARTFTPVIAGVGKMPRRRFTTYNAIGAVVWSVSLIVAGALLGGIGFVSDHIELIGFGLVGASMVPVVVTVWRTRREYRRRSARGSTVPELVDVG